MHSRRLLAALKAINDEQLKSAVAIPQIVSMSMESFSKWWEGIGEELKHEPRRDVALLKLDERDRMADAYYAVSWAMVYFMLRSEPAYADVLKEYFIQESRGQGSVNTFDILLKGRTGESTERFQEKFHSYIRALK